MTARREKILVVKLADLGDTLVVTPALRALRLAFPAASIDALVTPIGARALHGLDSVDNLIAFQKTLFDRPAAALRPGALRAALRLGWDLRGAHYDRVFLMHHLFTSFGNLKYAALLAAIGGRWTAGLAEGPRPYLTARADERGFGWRHEADYWLAVAGLAGAIHPNPRLEIAYDESDRRFVRDLLGGLAISPDSSVANRLVALYPGSGAYSLARRWPAERFAAVGRALVDRLGARIVVVGGPDEVELGRAVGATIGDGAIGRTGRTTVPRLAALLGECRFLIGNEAGVTHVAVAAGRPVVAIVGPTNAAAWGPYDPGGTARHRVVRIRGDRLPCAPCMYRGYVPGPPDGCAERDCLGLVEVADVLRAATALWEETSRDAEAKTDAGGLSGSGMRGRRG